MAAPWERTLFHFADHVHDPSGEPRENYELLGRRPLGAAHATVDLSLWAPLALWLREAFLLDDEAIELQAVLGLPTSAPVTRLSGTIFDDATLNAFRMAVREEHTTTTTTTTRAAAAAG